MNKKKVSSEFSKITGILKTRSLFYRGDSASKSIRFSFDTFTQALNKVHEDLASIRRQKSFQMFMRNDFFRWTNKCWSIFDLTVRLRIWRICIWRQCGFWILRVHFLHVVWFLLKSNSNLNHNGVIFSFHQLYFLLHWFCCSLFKRFMSFNYCVLWGSL